MWDAMLFCFGSIFAHPIIFILSYEFFVAACARHFIQIWSSVVEPNSKRKKKTQSNYA